MDDKREPPAGCWNFRTSRIDDLAGVVDFEDYIPQECSALAEYRRLVLTGIEPIVAAITVLEHTAERAATAAGKGE